MALDLYVNGEPRRLDQSPVSANLLSVIQALGHNPQLVVTEHNGVIVPRSQWPNIPVGDYDSLEIVTIVGGGS
ncbi:sulfur carrier protein ThiS [Synechococcus sp. M16CYN]|uniref:sulfur carrier protein ThiS n=1 Tax=Synechococcus sp. M16CYN TaxID=3103139 RepID=UPI00324DD265